MLLERIRVNAADISTFGSSAVLRHLARFRSDKRAKVKLKGIGSIRVRQGTTDVEVLRQVFADKEYGLPWPEVRARFEQRYARIIERGRRPVILDAGANIGAASLWFGHLYPKAKIVAVEPDPNNAAMLRLNAGPNVIVCEAAIGAHNGHVSLSRQDVAWGVRTERSDTGIPVLTVQDCLAMVPNGESFIIKIDIEGFEKDLFSDNIGWMDDVFALFIEPHDWMLPGQKTSRAFQRAMVDRPFDLLVVGENLLYLRTE